MPFVRFDPSGRIYRAATQAAEIEDNTMTYAAPARLWVLAQPSIIDAALRLLAS